jgi:3-phenylpropionate/cinnamic acid dioxygenase small subunit
MTTAHATGGEALDLDTVTRFVYREARLADTHDYDAWEALWTDDAVYWVPAGADDIDPDTHVSVMYDNRRHAQTPKSRLARVVGNVEVLGTETADSEAVDTVVTATFVGIESRERGTVTWAGRITYRLRPVDGEVRMAYKKVALVDNDRPLPSVALLI